MAGEPAQLGGVVGGGEADHQVLPPLDGLVVELLRQIGQHAGDGLGLAGQHVTGVGGGTHHGEPLQAFAGLDQPPGFARGQVRGLDQPGRG